MFRLLQLLHQNIQDRGNAGGALIIGTSFYIEESLVEKGGTYATILL